ncbi:MAG: type III-B CRISPR module RAMP protein Cmr6 [Myxococcota bacterium]
MLLHPAAGQLVTDVGLLLHHTYGVPFLPGSALKGICRARAARMFGQEDPQLVVDLFGKQPPDPDDEDSSGGAGASQEDQDQAGVFDFYDALWVPEPPPEGLQVPREGWSPLALDIVNPHHPSYYERRPGARGNDIAAPDGTDDPRPVQTLSIAPGTRFRIVIEAWMGEGRALAPWLDWLVDDVLLLALDEDGIGAKTTAGYGRLWKVEDDRVVVPEVWTKVEVDDDPSNGADPGPREQPGADPPKPKPSGTKVTADLRYESSRKRLFAKIKNVGKADATGDEAARLLSSLPSKVAKRLRTGKPIPMSIWYEGNGKDRRITDVEV